MGCELYHNTAIKLKRKHSFSFQTKAQTYEN